MSDCDKNCSTCNENCSERDMYEKPHQLSNIKKVIGVVSGKGGVGKSLVTSTLAVYMNSIGLKTAVLDADITGPSIPKVFGVTQKAMGTQEGILPNKTSKGINIMSINLLLDSEDSPVIWRGPVIAGTVKQFWTDVMWGDIDVMFIDMPPGTGDVPLTVFQSIKLDGIIIVTSPQDLVSLIVKKAYNMADKMNIPIIGIVENMSYIKCPDCGKEIKLFGESKTQLTADELNIDFLGKLPIDTNIASLCDAGKIEDMDISYISKIGNKVKEKLNK